MGGGKVGFPDLTPTFATSSGPGPNQSTDYEWRPHENGCFPDLVPTDWAHGRGGRTSAKRKCAPDCRERLAPLAETGAPKTDYSSCVADEGPDTTDNRDGAHSATEPEANVAGRQRENCYGAAKKGLCGSLV